MNLRILTITDACPPDAYSGTIRVAKTLKYLQKAGHHCRVLTVHPRALRQDPDLAREIPASVPIHRTVRFHPGPLVQAARALRDFLRRSPDSPSTGSGKLRNLPAPPSSWVNQLHAWLFVPDELLGWFPFAVRAGHRLIREERPDLIFSTGPAHGCHLPAAWLARQTGIPHVVEFRDPWLANDLARFASPLHRRLQAMLETRVLGGAAGLVTVARSAADLYRETWPGLPVETVYNAWDHPLPDRAGRQDDGNVRTITHAGMFYEGRSPDGFLRGVAGLSAAERSRFRFRFIGGDAGLIRDRAGHFGIPDRVETPGAMAHGECQQELAGADYLLLIPGRIRRTIPGKLFEYLGLGRPILCLTDPSTETAELLAAEPHRVVRDDDPAAVTALLRALLDQSPPPPRAPDRRYCREFQVYRLARFFESLIPRRS